MTQLQPQRSLFALCRRSNALTTAFATPFFHLALLVLCIAFAVLSSSCSNDDFGKDSTSEPYVAHNVVYQVFVRNYASDATLAGVERGLDSIKALGTTVVWLMPIHPIGVERRNGQYGSPYAVRDYLSVDPLHGTTNDLKSLVRAAHTKGMKVILDFVGNHTAWDHEWIRTKPEYYTRNAQGAITHPPGTNWLDVADLNFNNTNMRRELLQTMLYWIRECDIDGYRCDHVDGVPNTFWREAIDSIRAIKRDAFMLAEAGDTELYSVGFDAVYSWQFYDLLKNVLRGGSAAQVGNFIVPYTRNSTAKNALFFFTSNHDKMSWEGTPMQEFGSLAASQAATVIAALMPTSSMMLYNGQEIGSTQRQNLFAREPIQWNINPNILAFHRNLFALRRAYPVLREGNITFHFSSTDVVMFSAQQRGTSVCVAVNVRNSERMVTLPGEFSSASVKFGNGTKSSANVTLPAFGYIVVENN